MLTRRLIVELRKINEEPIENCSAGLISNDITKWKATIIGPTDTPYEGGIFNLNIEFTENYPYKPPIVYFTTPIYHCNINSRGGICLDILKNNWSPALTVVKLLMSICSLLSEPNPNDPLVPEIAKLYINNRKQHDINAKEYTLKYAFNS
jgi:ubiquitin-conjugating enzyme E2 D/E